MPKKFSNFKREIREVYDKIGSVWCPAIQEEVYFNAKGFYHLRHETTREERSISEQKHKLSLVPHIKDIVQGMQVLVESRTINNVVYTSLTGKPQNHHRKVKVILRKSRSTERTIFWSVMGGGNKKRL